MDQVLKVTLKRKLAFVVEYFRVIPGQESTARNFVAVFAHNAGLKAAYETFDAAPDGVNTHAASAIDVEKVVAASAQRMLETAKVPEEAVTSQ